MSSEKLKSVVAWMCLVVSAPALAGEPRGAPKQKAGEVKAAERYARRCQEERGGIEDVYLQGTMLWGAKRGWGAEVEGEEQRSVLVSVELKPVEVAGQPVKGLRLEGGRLEAEEGGSVVGQVLRGRTSEGKEVEVAVCGAEPAAAEEGWVWYRLKAWNAVAQQWENPCEKSEEVQDPRAVAVGGVWDGSGARREVEGQFTLACERGAITKCIRWGYKPWASHAGHSLAQVHQACTRMARADYCGDGQSHTKDNTLIDMYDVLGVLAPTTEPTPGWDPGKASFEAAWGTDGAVCLARTRDRRAVEEVMRECRGRFKKGEAVELGEGDRCTVRRTGARPGEMLLRNRAY